jgi:hypothetical protein
MIPEHPTESSKVQYIVYVGIDYRLAAERDAEDIILNVFNVR